MATVDKQTRPRLSSQSTKLQTRHHSQLQYRYHLYLAWNKNVSVPYFYCKWDTLYTCKAGVWKPGNEANYTLQDLVLIMLKAPINPLPNITVEPPPFGISTCCRALYRGGLSPPPPPPPHKQQAFAHPRLSKICWRPSCITSFLGGLFSPHKQQAFAHPRLSKICWRPSCITSFLGGLFSPHKQHF